jgi:O-acetyl-ADP-ribose deacetylase (regulator of RNase III)
MGQREASFPASVRMGFVVDVAGYGGRSAREKIDVQHRVAALIDDVTRDLGLRLDETLHHGTGDGMVVFLPSDLEVHRALAGLLRSTPEALAEDNQRYRLVSEQLYAHAVRERYASPRAEDFQPVNVRTKEFHGRAWLWQGPAAREESPSPVVYELAPAGCLVGVRNGQIMRVRDVDIWVNSENTDMEMARFNEFSISGIIRYNGSRRDAGGHVVDDVIGDELARAVDGYRPVAPGTAFVTGPGALADTNSVRWVIHVAAAHGEPGAGFRQISHVGACVANALARAERLAADDDKVRTILFPVLGTGVARAPVTTTAAELVAAAADHIAATPRTRLRGVYFLGYTEQERAALTDALAAHPALRRAPMSGTV